jgi:hypothetical protein
MTQLELKRTDLTSMTTQPEPMETDQDKQAELPGPRAQPGPRRGIPVGGRGRGGGLPLRAPMQAHLGLARQRKTYAKATA